MTSEPPQTPSYRTTFFRLLGFLRGYKLTLFLSVVLAAISQLGTLAFPALTGLVVNAIDDGDRQQAAVADRRRAGRRDRQGGGDARAAADLRASRRSASTTT